MISDVPLGAFLSGGIDSSITVALMAQHSGQPVKTFFIDFEDPRYSEKSFAQAVAHRYGTEHHEFIVRPDAVGILDKLVHFFDEPFGDSSAIPTYYVSQYTRKHVTVALAGDGGDEGFGGYHSYRNILRRGELPGLRPVIGPIGGLIHRLLPRRTPGRRYFRSLGMSNATFFSVGTQEAETRELLSRDFLQHVSHQVMDEVGGDVFTQHTNGSHDPLSAYTRFDTQWYLPDDVLTKADRMSMAHSLELRGPFLDYRIAELAARMPAAWKISEDDTKVLLKETFRDELPEQVLHPRKRGFSIPLGAWLRGELRPILEEVIHDRELEAAGFFNMREIRELAGEHLRGTRPRAPQLWRFLFFARWWQVQRGRADTGLVEASTSPASTRSGLKSDGG
jgi:asparagine synthase (glutamine-hydrolysing)